MSQGAASGVLIWLVLLPLSGAVLPRWVTSQTAQRAAVGLLLGTAAAVAYLLFSRGGLGGVFDPGAGAVSELVQPLWRVLVVQRLQLGVGLALDRPAAVLLGAAALGGAGAVHTAERGRVAWLAGACAATAVALLGDGLVTRLVGWELLTVAGWALSRRRSGKVLLVARLGDATLLIATALLFWALAGSWSSSRLAARYELDVSPPQSTVAAGQVGPGGELGSTLDLTSLRAQLHQPVGGEQPSVQTVRATLANKLWMGGRLLTWLGMLFGLAAALKALAGALQGLGERRASGAMRLWLGVAPGLCAGHLLWRLW